MRAPLRSGFWFLSLRPYQSSGTGRGWPLDAVPLVPYAWTDPVKQDTSGQDRSGLDRPVFMKRFKPALSASAVTLPP